MLIQFNFKNYKSYKNETTLDMTATKITEFEFNVAKDIGGNDLLRVASIYGANASGKTGVIEAFGFMRKFIIESFEKQNKQEKIPIKNFAFESESRKGKSEFEVFFTIDNIEYQYGFVLDTNRVHEEYLYKRNYKVKDRYDILFERDIKNIKFGEEFKGAKQIKELLEDRTLLLTLTSQLKIEESKKVFDWFLNNNVIDFGNSFTESILSRILPEKMDDNNFDIKSLEEFMKAIDVGIEGINIKKSEDDEKTRYKVYSLHKVMGTDELQALPFREESSGTQKMFALYRFIIDALRNGTVLFIDELDAKIHPLLLRYIINMFHNSEINKTNAQLIYTTHDIYTLTKETFRRDEVWLAEKNIDGVSKLYALVEYKMEDNKKVRKDASYNKEYLNGRYGAIPLLKEFNIKE